MSGRKPRAGAVLKYAGAFIACVIGSGFATGQEILQFFSAYGFMSYAVVAANLLGFLFFGRVIMTAGYDHREEKKFDCFTWFCGRRSGLCYSWLMPVILIPVMSVLISGAGATLFEYYGIDRFIGSAVMTAAVLFAYLAGFERLIKIVSMIGPVIIAFALLVGIITVIKDMGNAADIVAHERVLLTSRSSPSWALSAPLYLSLNFLGSGPYYAALGASGTNRRSVEWGAALGAAAVMLVITVMNTAILLNAGDISLLAIPTLYFARRISYILGAAFSIVLILGMFSASATTMWTICSRFSREGGKKSRLIAIGVAAGSYILSLFSFSELLGTIYPIIGYIGLPFLGFVIYRSLREFIKKRLSDKKRDDSLPPPI